MITVTINGEKKQYSPGITYETIANEYQEQYGGQIALVAVNGKIRELFKTLKKECSIHFFTLQDVVGHKTYVRTATMLFLKAVFFALWTPRYTFPPAFENTFYCSIFPVQFAFHF